MRRPVIVRPAAEADIQEIHECLEEIRMGLGERFTTRLRDAFEAIERMPETFTPIWEDVRAIRLRKFQYVVYYIVFEDRVEVLAVLHGARHESAWQSRIHQNHS